MLACDFHYRETTGYMKLFKGDSFQLSIIIELQIDNKKVLIYELQESLINFTAGKLFFT
jgi:hypothetical protein